MYADYSDGANRVENDLPRRQACTQNLESDFNRLMSTPTSSTELAPAAAPDEQPSGAQQVLDTVEDIDRQAVTVIEARPGWRAIDFAELWRYRDLIARRRTSGQTG